MDRSGERVRPASRIGRVKPIVHSHGVTDNPPSYSRLQTGDRLNLRISGGLLMVDGSTPNPSRMTSPGYGFENSTSRPGARFPWSRVEEALAGARNYWIATVTPEGRPHAAPVWAIWLNSRVYFSTGKESRKGRNLASNPHATVHVETPDGSVVIVEGRAEELSDEAKLKPVWNAYNQK